MKHTDLINKGSLLLSIRSPQQEHDSLRTVANVLDDCVSQLLPPLVLVRVWRKAKKQMAEGIAENGGERRLGHCGEEVVGIKDKAPQRTIVLEIKSSGTISKKLEPVFGSAVKALFGYDGQSNDLKFISKGAGGVEELTEDLNSGKIMYAFCKVMDPKTSLPKCVLINWQGEGAPHARKGTCANHVHEVTNFFKGVHVTLNARNEEEVDPQIVIDKVAKSTGSAYSFKDRGDLEKESGPVGTVYKRVIPKQEINTRERDKFWEKEEQEEKQRQAEEKNRKEEERSRIESERKQRELREAEKSAEERTKEVTPADQEKEDWEREERERRGRTDTEVSQPIILEAKQPARETTQPQTIREATQPQIIREATQPIIREALQVAQCMEEEELLAYSNGQDDLGLQARALYDYQAADSTEITFDPGDIITHIDQIDEGWWQGLGPDGTYGLFPANYVELLN
uniref:(California timema) hypothetical protein n=1 Tax=Timema californicum TaxID=61474 RepID=A0A7R9J8W8_TIMCA|nr:unnamed protein product [Timema californicum]